MKDSSVSVVRHRHSRRRRKNARTKFLVVLLFAATAAVTWQFARPQPVSKWSYSAPDPNPVGLNQVEPSEDRDYSSFIASRPSRPSYRYSVVPGGVASAEELREAVEHDPIVAREFAGFDFQRAHLVQVSENQSMHVAYRMGDKVYWTRKKIALHKGETLISDGKIVARTRCGNRIAIAPLGPPAIVDPVDADFDQPLFSNDMVTHAAEPQPETYAGMIPPVEANALQPTKHRKIPFFIIPYFGEPGGGGTPKPHTPLASAPEPGTMLLLSSGLVGVYMKVRKSRSKR